MELVPKAEFSIVTRASPKAWIPELIAAAGPQVTETYIDFFTSTIRNRNTRAAYARACWQFFDWCATHGLELALPPQSSFVRIGQGRDAADTSFATIFGGAVTNQMELEMQPRTGQCNFPEYTTAPISNYPSAAQPEKQSCAPSP
jgi:hypothetical protein